MTGRIPLLALLILLHRLLTAAQTTDVSCASTSSTAFLFNKYHESPCLVWSKLQALCLPPSSSVNIPSLLGNGYGYILPTSDSTVCECNAVAYNLMAGCTYCQLHDASSIVSESAFAASCTAYTSTGLPFDESVLAIPAYAWEGWSGKSWTPAQAVVAASRFADQAYPTGTYSASLTRSFAPHADAPTPTSTAATTSTPPSASDLSTSSNTGPQQPGAPGSQSSSSTTTSSPQSSASSASTPSHRKAIIACSTFGALALLSLVLLFLFRRYQERKNGRTSLPGTLSPSAPRPLAPQAAQEAFGSQYDPRSILSFSDIPPGGQPRRFRHAGAGDTWDEKGLGNVTATGAFQHPRTAALAVDSTRDSRWRYTGETGYTGYTGYTGRSGYSGGEAEYDYEFTGYSGQMPGTATTTGTQHPPVQPGAKDTPGASPDTPNPHQAFETPSAPPRPPLSPRRPALHSREQTFGQVPTPQYSPEPILTGKGRLLQHLSPRSSRPSHPQSIDGDSICRSPARASYPESVDFSVQIPTPAASRPGSKYRPSARYTGMSYLDRSNNAQGGRNRRLTSDVATLPSLYDPGTAAVFRSQARYSAESKYPPTAQFGADGQRWAATPLPPIPTISKS